MPDSGNLNVDPLFISDPDDGGDGFGDDPATPAIDESLNDDYGDLRLQSISPAIDAGSDGWVPADDLDLDDDGDLLERIPIDLDSGPRFLNAAVDMGAYESDHCPADSDGNGLVNVNDLLDLLAKWGLCPAPCPEDNDGSGEVNVNDLLALLTAWVTCE